MRLNQVVKEQKENEGRIEFCTSGEWGLLCYDTWDNNDASVICRQLGFSVEDTSKLINYHLIFLYQNLFVFHRQKCASHFH